MKEVRKAVFPVAGRGTRFLPATKAVPKELLPILNRPLIDYAIEEARAAGIEEFIFVIGDGKEAIVEHLTANPELLRELREQGKKDLAAAAEACEVADGKAIFVRQEKPLGLGHAIGCARDAVGDEPFAVILPDDFIMAPYPCMAQLLNAHAAFGGNVAAVLEVPRDRTRKYGILKIDESFGHVVRASGLVEKPSPSRAPSQLAIIGRYVLEPGIFEEIGKGIVGAGGEIQVTDAITARIGAAPFHGVRFEGTRFDCGSKEGFFQATVATAMCDPALVWHLRSLVEPRARAL